MTSTRSHKRKNSHLFLQRKNSSSADMSIELNSFPNKSNPPSSSANPMNPHDIEDQPLPRTSSSFERWNLQSRFTRKNSRFALISITVSIILATLFIIPIYTSSEPIPKDDNGTASKKSFTIKEVLNGDFLNVERPFQFIRPSTLIYHRDADPGLFLTTEVQKEPNEQTKYVARQLYNPEFREDLGQNKFLYEGIEHLIQTVTTNYRLDRMIIGTDIEPEFRHSSKGYYWLKDIEQGILRPITPLGTGELQKVSYVRFSPNYNFLYFVYANNLFVQNVYTGEAPRQLTTDGSSDIFYGKPDWVYEEEILSSDNAVWWSPDDSKMVFAMFNDTQVESYLISKFTTNQNYPPTSSIKYPKPGTPNPKVQLFLFDLVDGVIYLLSNLQLTDDIDDANADTILYDADWIGPHSFMFKVTDRTSKRMSVKVYNTKSGTLKTVRSVDSSLYNGWVEKARKMLPIPPNEAKNRNVYGYIDIQADPNGFNHLFYFGSASSNEGVQITRGNWEISGKGIVGYEYDSDTVFFTANEIGSISQHLYGITLDPKGETHLRIYQDSDAVEDFYDYEFSSSGRYALMRMLGPGAPISAAGMLSDVLDYRKLESKHTLSLTDNSKLDKTLNKYNLPVTSYKSMTTDDGVTINYVEIKPALMDPKKKYPVLVNVYGGPGSQTFTTKFNVFFEQAVSSGLDAIVLQIEPRGTGGRGWKFKSMVKEKIGYWEPRDITQITKSFLQQNSANIDKNRVAIWGWSYGGYTSLKTVELDQGETFKYMMAVAPVTNWTFYDSFYTERYMNTPSENPSGYNDISVVQDLNAFRKLQRFIVVHGSADDNVHIQNTYQLLDSLDLLGITNYDMHIFPDSDHSIRHHNAQKVIFEKLYYWLRDAFSGEFDTRQF